MSGTVTLTLSRAEAVALLACAGNSLTDEDTTRAVLGNGTTHQIRAAQRAAEKLATAIYSKGSK
jgi:hypothetical protein